MKDVCSCYGLILRFSLFLLDKQLNIYKLSLLFNNQRYESIQFVLKNLAQSRFNVAYGTINFYPLLLRMSNVTRKSSLSK